jgi:hypothetical protein
MPERRQLLIKFMLIFVAEAIAFPITYKISQIVPVKGHSMLIHVLGGALLAVLIISIYNMFLRRKAEKAREDLRELTKITYKQFSEDQDDRDRK